MKKFLIIVLILVLIGGAMYLVWDTGLINDILRDHMTGLEYDIRRGGYAVVGLGSYKESSDIVIPNTHLGKPVCEIEEYAFAECNNLESITIPYNVLSIGEGAFAGCRNLKEVKMDFGGPASIGKNAFAYCSSLTSIALTDAISIGEGAFSGCSSLESMTLSLEFTSVTSSQHAIPPSKPEGIRHYTQTDYYPFGFIFGTTSYPESIEIHQTSRCDFPAWVTSYKEWGFIIKNDLLNEVETEERSAGYYIPESLTSLTIVGSHTFVGNEFENLSNLTNIVIEGNVIGLGKTLKGCDSLASIRFTESVEKISNEKVRYWKIPSSLTNITVDSGNSMYYSDGNCLVERESKTLLLGCNSSVIPQGVTSIGKSAFGGCEGLTNVTIPNSVTSIGEWAFHSCSNLTSITFEGTVEQWNAITFGSSWKFNLPATEVVCSDGVVKLN